MSKTPEELAAWRAKMVAAQVAKKAKRAAAAESVVVVDQQRPKAKPLRKPAPAAVEAPPVEDTDGKNDWLL